MEVCGQTFTPDVLNWVAELVASEPTLSRSVLSRRLCEKLDWRDARGRWKQMSARVALLQLHRQGLVALPPPQGAVAGAVEVGAVRGEAPALSLTLAELERYEADLILKALEQNGWDRKQAARSLGLPLRTLAHKMQSHGIRRIGYTKDLG